jgi:hypothetical protein
MRNLLLVLTALLVVPASASAAWGPPRPLSSASGWATIGGVAADSADHPSVLLNERRKGGWALVLRKGATRRTVTATRNTLEPQGLFAGSDGDLAAGWLEIVNGTRRPVVATGPRLEDRQVLAPGPRSTQIMSMAGNRRGDAVVAFWRYRGSGYEVFASVRRAGGRFGTPQVIGTGRPGWPHVAMGQDGSAAVVWTEKDGVHVVDRPAKADAFAPAVTLSAPRPTSDAAVATDKGRIIVSWIGPAQDVEVAERAAVGEPFSAPEVVNRRPTRIPRRGLPSLALQGNRALVAWLEGDEGTADRDRAMLAVRGAVGGWGTPVAREVRGPEHAYSVSLVAPAQRRPVILMIVTTHGFRFGIETATVRAAGLAPSRRVATGSDIAFGSEIAQGGRHAWLAAARRTGRERFQALLFRDV